MASSLVETTAQIIQGLNTGDREAVRLLLEGVRAGELAQILQSLSAPLREELIQVIRPSLDPEVLTFLDESVREELTRLLNPQEIAAAVSDLESDDALLVIEDLDEEQQEQVLRSIAPQERQNLEERLRYPEDSAGRLMQREMVVLAPHTTVMQAMRYVARNKNLPDVFYGLFVVDEHSHPVGFVPLSRLLQSSQKKTLEEVMTPEIRTIPVGLDQETVALRFRQCALSSAPVVNDEGILLGVITIDDIMDVIEEEAEEDIMHLGGIAFLDFYAPILSTSFARLQWLILTLLNTLLASTVIAQFQMTLEKKVTLAVLMPIVAAMGGSAGMQVVTVTVRALSNESLNYVNMRRNVIKEIVVSFLNGLVCSVVLGTVSFLWYHDMSLSFVLGSAMIFNMLWAGFAGTLIPILVSWFKMDPALSAGPLLNTTTDVFGFAIFLGLAKWFLL